MEKIRTNINLDTDTRERMETFPGRVSASAIIRCLIRAATTPDEKEWEEIISKDPDMKKARDSIRRKLKDAGRKTIAL